MKENNDKSVWTNSDSEVGKKLKMMLNIKEIKEKISIMEWKNKIMSTDNIHDEE
jgi:hypothetical protein